MDKKDEVANVLSSAAFNRLTRDEKMVYLRRAMAELNRKIEEVENSAPPLPAPKKKAAAKPAE